MNRKKAAIVVLASTQIRRSDFGMRELSLLVSDTVTFDITIEASRLEG